MKNGLFNSFKKTSNFHSTIAFTIVEVALALAICAVSLIAILALIPLAVQSQRLSSELSTSSLIARKLVSEARQADFDTLLSSPTTSYRYFDDEGFEVPRSQQIYTAELVLKPQADVPGPSSSRVNLNDFAQLRVRIAKNQSGRIGTDSAVFSNPDLIVHTSAAYVGRKESKQK